MDRLTCKTLILLRKDIKVEINKMKKALFLVIGSLLLLWAANVNAQISGTVFRDFNANGVFDNTSAFREIGVQGVSITAYNSAGTAVGTAISDALGNYTIASVTGALRVEFTNFPSPTDYSSAKGLGNGTSVQFVNGGATNVNFAINAPIDYSQSNPLIALPCYENGLSTGNNNVGIVGFAYNSSQLTGTKRNLASISEVGAVWGTAYQRSNSRLFAGAFLKRHVGLGAQGLGGLYVLDNPLLPSPPVSSYNLQGITPVSGGVLDFGSINRSADAFGLSASNFQLFTSNTTPNIDLDSYTKVGKVGMGDVDIDETGERLWGVNLNQRSLFSIDINGSLPGAINHYNIESFPGYATCPTYTNTGTTTLRINAGGGQITDAQSNVWIADDYFSGATAFQVPTITNTNNPYEATTDGSIYTDVRSGSNYAYNIPVTNGRYKVVLHTRTSTDNAEGQRVVDISAEGVLVSNNWDPIAAIANVQNRASTVIFVTNVTDGVLNISLVASNGNFAMAGIEVIPVASGSSGVVRPWALAFQNGKGYLGVVCDASNSMRPEDLRATVLSFDPNNVNAGFTTEASFGLNYTRERNSDGSTMWDFWRNDITMSRPNSEYKIRATNPQPILSDIEFTENGSMVLGFLDRVGHQEGFVNKQPFAGTLNAGGSGPRVAGDIIHLCKVNGAFVLEQGNNGTTCGSNDVLVSGSIRTSVNDGPSNAGEFYYQDYFFASGGDHGEVATGGLLKRKGTNEILSTVWDPTPSAAFGGLFSQGVHWYNNNTGARTDAFVVVEWNGSYTSAEFGKASGLGDPEFLSAPAPLEIGNRVWDDTDKDGIQDADEVGISGVTVQLFLASNPTTPIATATTAFDGTYYFSSATGTSTPSTIYGLTLLPNINYILKFPTTTNSKNITAINSGTNDLIDSDANTTTGEIALIMGNAGQNNHSFDVGYSACIIPTTTATAMQPNCNGVNAPNNGGITLNSFTTGQRYQYSSGLSFNSAAATPASITTIPAGGVIASSLPNTTGNYTVRIYDASDNSCYVDRVVSITAVNCCVKPAAVITNSVQTICVGGTATAYIATPSTGVDYKWYGPLTSTSGSLGTAISGATSATFTPSGAALTTSGTKYYAVVVNTTGDATCADTAFVQLDVRSLAITVSASSCTPATNKFSVSGQVTFTAPPSTGVLRVRIPGKGYQDFLPPFTSPISYTIPDLNSDGVADTVEVMFSDGVCKQTAIYTAPAMCLPNACTGAEVAGKSEYKFTVPLKRTNWSDTLSLPKFDTMGGTRTLKNVLLTVNQSIVNWGVAESTDSAPSEINIETTGTTTFKLDGVNFETNSFSATNYPKNVTSAVLVPTVGTWPGDNTAGSSPSTLFAMSSTVNADLNNLVNPTLSPTWVTNQTGDLTDDDDMTYFAPVYSDNTKCWLYSNPTDLGKFTGVGNVEFIARATASSFVSGSGNINTIIKTSANAEITVTYIYCSTTCVKPVAAATPQTQTICVGGTASAFIATPSTGVEYKWYGPLTSVTASLGTAISGATNATFTPTGTALTTAGAKFYAVVVNTTGDAACADTAFVQLNVSQLSVPAATALCHANGTPENGADDYMTFSVRVSTTPMNLNTFTVTATQAGNPLAVTLSNGSAATSVNCGLNTPLRTPAGSAGKGNVTLTITDNVTGCTTTVVVTDPGTCAVTCVQGTPSIVTYEYATQVDRTELSSLPIVIPKFDEQGGTRVLKSVKLEYLVGGKTAFVFENRAAQSQLFSAKATSEATINLNGTNLATNNIEMVIPQTTLPGGILVPATGSWVGDSIPSPIPTPTTLGRMASWVSDYLVIFKDPRTDARWVTNATGDATDDDDIYINPMIADSVSGTFTYNTALALAPFIGTGNVPLNVSTLSSLSVTGGGGNLYFFQRTRAYASAKVTYTYECILCTKPVAIAAPKVQTICAGSPASVYRVAPSTGVDYKWYGPLADTTSSLGTAISGATSATFTPSGAALTTVGTKYYAVVVNTTGDETCADTAYVRLVVNAKPNIADGSATICAGESVNLTSRITNYATYLSPVWTVGTASGTTVATPTSVKPTGTTTYILVAQNALGCKDTANVVVTVNPKPNAGKDTTLVCVNAATNTLATSYTLVPTPAGGTWSQLGTTPATATITGNNVTNMTVAGTYQFIYTTVAGCKDTVAVTVAPCAGCVKPNAGSDAASVCQPTATAKLTALTTGGTWAPIGSPANPSAASIDANGNITGLNASGTYRFVYSITSGGQTCTDTAQVVVNTKPNIADGSATICAGESVNLTSRITNYATYLSPVWTVGTASGTAVATPTSMKPTGTTTYVLVAQNAAGCKDTANVVVTVNPKPNAGKDTTLVCVNAATNTLATSYTLVPTPAGGTWGQLGTTPATATITGNNVTNMSVAGTYQFIYTTTAGCKDTVAVTVAPCAGCVKPNAGSDAASVCQPTSTAKLTAVTTGGTWAPIGSPANPSAASIDANGNIAGLNAAGTYRFVYSVTGGGQTCTDTAQVVVNAKPTIADGSAAICAGESVDLTSKITNYATYQSPVWTVGTASGTAVATPASVKPIGTTTYVLVAQNALGCKDTANVVVTVNAKPSAGKDTTLVCSNGNVPSSVQLSATPTGGTWSALTGNPTGATVNSSGLASITNATAPGKSFNFIYSVNGCQDTVKVIVPTCPPPCIKSTITSAAPVCSNDAQTYSFTFTVANKLGILKVNKGTLSGNNPYTVSGIPSGQNVIITDSLSAICKSDTIIAGVNCNCNPALPQLLTPSLTVCKGDTFPTLKATVVGLATVEWFSQQTGGTVLFTGLNFKPSGTATANTIFYAQARSTDPICPTAISTSRVPATINAQTCIDTIDLALKKSIDKKIEQVGDVLTYTIKVWNEWTKNATGVEVTDSIATTVQFVSGSFSSSRGNATISGNVITWTIGNIAAAGAPANGDTVTLSYQVKATQAGVHLNTAEISKTNEKDRDSTPGNGKGGEDDIDQQCFTVPYGLCAGQKLEVSVPAGLTNVQWFKNGGSTAVATGNVVLLSEVGTYTFTATNKTCPANGCCPVIIEAGTNCCPVDICVPFTVKKVKK